ARRAECAPDADVAAAPGDGERDQSVKPDGGEQQRRRAEPREQCPEDPAAVVFATDDGRERTDLPERQPRIDRLNLARQDAESIAGLGASPQRNHHSLGRRVRYRQEDRRRRAPVIHADAWIGNDTYDLDFTAWTGTDAQLLADGASVSKLFQGEYFVDHGDRTIARAICFAQPPAGEERQVEHRKEPRQDSPLLNPGQVVAAARRSR